MDLSLQLQDLRRISLPAGVQALPGNGGLPKLTIKNSQAEAEVYLQGAHVSAFQPKGQKPVLWMSAKSWFEPGKPLRGGVPICWPWFGPHPSNSSLPGHGFARLKPWTLTRAAQLPDGRTQLCFQLRSGAQTRQIWPDDFGLEYDVAVGTTLELALRVRNPGATPLKCDEALHTYLAIGDARRVGIRGLQGVDFIDKMNQGKLTRQTEETLNLTAETDRVYVDSTQICVVHDPVWNRTLRIAKKNSWATVVWNPWIKKAKAMPDFGDDEWPEMLCIETANAAQNALVLAPNAVHEMQADIGII
ncbi:MAG: D-hexose-6-phosphate mutarotase [Planctomycetota bacterium]